MIRFVLLAALMFASLFLSGCATHDPADSNIPWNRPAGWEDSLPGMDHF